MANDDHNQPPSELNFETEHAPAENSRRRHLIIGGSILAGLIALTLILMNPVLHTFTKVAFPQPVPSADRYYYIDNFLKKIDYENAGRVIAAGYDESFRHGLDPAYFTATVEGSDAFELLTEQMKAAAGEVECSQSETKLDCNLGRPRATLVDQGDGTVLLSINDIGGGRE